MSKTVDLFIYHPETAEFIHTHSIPLQDCLRFAISPLRWLCYLGSITYGREGWLEMAGPTSFQRVEDYDLPIEPRVYHFRSGGIFLVF